ncbi:MAG: hypothetical protein SPI15_02705 [Candidatus Faecousia sp.]|nr:hypothetical protein [Clostridiales bacterium]MDY6179738.1 hypothetical protein [Candidatus Faecousia sp.]
MKLFIRKPLLPCVLLVLLAFSVCFMTLFQQSILDNQLAVDEMYNSVQLTFQVLPGVGSDGVLKLRNKTVTALQAVEGVTDCFYYLQCPYSLREPVQLANYSTVYGTNDLAFFAKEQGVSITYADGWDEQSVLSPGENGTIPCLLETNLAEVLEVEAGDSFVIAPNAGKDTDPGSAPSLTMVVAGTFADETGLVDLYSIVVSADTFPGRSGFLYTSDMMGAFYYYRAFHFHTDPARNRDFQTLKENINSVLKKDGDFLLYSNVRILEQTIRPIEQKIRIQQMLVTPLSILLCLASSLMTVFLCASFSEEVFLRLLWGEKRRRVWLSMMGALILLIAAEGAVTILIAWLVSGTKWISWAVGYLLLTMCLCVGAAAIQQFVYCGRNLVAFYQSKED